MKKTILIFLWFCSIGNNLIAQQDTSHYNSYLLKNGLKEVEHVYKESQAINLIKLWDSFYPNNKALVYRYISAYRWEKIIEFNRQGAKQHGNFKLYRKLCYPLAIVYHRETKYDKSTPLLIEVTKFKQELTPQKLKEAYLRLETSYRATGQFSDAVKIRRIRINKGFINNFWELYSASGLYKEAIQDFKLFEKIPTDDDFEKIRYFNKIGTLHLDAGQADSAIHYFYKMKRQADFIIKNPEYSGKNSYSESVKEYYKAIAIANIAEGYILKGHFLYAIPKLKQAIIQCKKIGEVDQKIVKWLHLAQCYLSINQAMIAKLYLDSSKTAMINKRMLPSELKLLKLYAQCNKQLGNNKGYINSMSDYLQLKETVLTVNQTNQSILLLANMDMQQQKLLLVQNQKALQISRLDQAHKQKVIYYIIAGILSLATITGLLFYNIRIQIKSRKAISAQNKRLLGNEIKINSQKSEKEILLKEVHHRVKNNMQVMCSLLNLQKRRVENEEVRRYLDALHNRIRSMAMVHQQLYIDKNLREINAETYIKNLVLHISTIFVNDQQVELVYEIDKVLLPLEKAIPVGLIVNEAVSNAFKYAFVQQKKGVLNVSLKIKNSACVLAIADNGEGFEEDNIGKKSLGIQLITNMAAQLKAIYTRNSEKGTLHELSFEI